MIPALLAMTRTAAAAGGRSFAKDAAASLVSGPAAQANKAAAAEKALGSERDAAKKATDGLGKSLKDFRGHATETVAQVYLLKSSFEGLTGLLTGQMTAGAQALKTIADPLANLVALSNPGAVKMFEMAFNDAMAVVGRAGTGAMAAFTRSMEKLGDTYAKFEPLMKRLFDAIGDLVETTFNAMADSTERLAPAMELMFTVLTNGVKVAEVGAKVFYAALKPLQMLVGLFGQLTGFGGGINKGATAKGSAIRDVKISDSAQDYARRAQESAFQQAFATGPTKEEPTAVLPAMALDIQAIKGFVKSIDAVVSAATNLPGKVADAVPAVGGAGQVSGSVAEAIIDFARMIRSSRTD